MRLHLYKRPCPLVGPLVMLSSKSIKMDFNRFKMIWTVLDEEKRGTRGKEGLGGRKRVVVVAELFNSGQTNSDLKVFS